MKTIKEGAKELAQKNYHHEQTISADIKHACQEMAVFMQLWITVEDELPEETDNLTQTEKYIYTENPVLVRTINGKYAVSKRSKFKENENSKWEWIGSSSFSDSVTHWRPIELK